MINWIDDKIAVTDVGIGRRDVRERLEGGNYLVIDVRVYFTQEYDHLIDGSMPRDSIWDFVKFLVGLEGFKVILHCYGGIDRSPFVAALYMSARYKLSIDEAYRVVKEKRPQTFIHPEWIEWVEKELGESWDDYFLLRC